MIYWSEWSAASRFAAAKHPNMNVFRVTFTANQIASNKLAEPTEAINRGEYPMTSSVTSISCT